MSTGHLYSPSDVYMDIDIDVDIHIHVVFAIILWIAESGVNYYNPALKSFIILGWSSRSLLMASIYGWYHGNVYELCKQIRYEGWFAVISILLVKFLMF